MPPPPPPPPPPHPTRLLLEQIPCERLPTDYDRAARPEEQAYDCGIVHSSLSPSLSSFFIPFQHQQQQQQQQQRTSNSCDDDDDASPPLPNDTVTLVTLYGILLKRYVREPEIMLAVVLEEEEGHQRWVGVPLDGVVGLEISIADAVGMVDALLRGRRLLKSQQEATAAAAATATATATDFLSSQAFVIDGSLSSPSAPSPPPPPSPPCAWPVLSFSVAAPSDWHSDLLLVVKKQQQEDDDADDTGPPSPCFSFVYNTHLFSEPMIEAMMRSWETLLIQAAAATNLSIRQDLVPVVSAIDEKMMASAWNQTDTFFSWSSHLHGIHQLFEACVDEGPSRVAVVGPSTSSSNDYLYPEQVQQLTYGELDKQANRLAHLLSQQQQQHCFKRSGDVGEEDAGVCIVAILMERSVEFYVAMLAVLKAGAAYLSIDTDYPDERIRFMIQDSGAVAVVTTQALVPRLAGAKTASCEIIVLDEPAQVATLSKLPSTRLSLSTTTTSAATSSRLCYVIYTSGSTGKPKGVQISHANVLNLICGEQVIYQVRPSDRVLQGFSTSFDASVEEIWMAFSNGAALVVGTKDLMRSGPDFPHYLKRLGVTCLSTVPTLLATLVVSGSQDGHHQEDLLPCVRLIITGGEACSKELVTRWASKKGRRFFNTYGPTETTVIATYKEYSSSSSSSSSSPLPRISIGRPLANYQCYVVDGHMNLLPPGALGELVIGGASVSQRGYLNLSDKTKSVFVHDHLHHHHHHSSNSATSGSTTTSTNCPLLLYKSGDLARFSMVPATSGEIEYHGRVDTQVKIRGYRVEPHEIESVLSTLPGIKNAVVDVQQQAPGTMKQLVAFVIPSSSSSSSSAALDTAGLLQALREKLPAFMMPSHIEVVASFPTLPSGKVDRRRLPQVLRLASRRHFTRSLTRSGSSRPGGVLPVGGVTGAGGEGEMDDDDNDDEQAEFDGDGDVDCEPPSQKLLLYRKIVTETFETVLGLPPKTLKNSPDFFDLGGNSLLVSLLVTKLRRHYPAVTARDVYGNSTVKGLAQVIEKLQASAEAADVTAAVNNNTSKSNALSGPTTTSTSHSAQQPIYIPSRGTTFIADLVQFVAMYFLAAYMGMNGFVIYTLYFNYKDLPTFQALVLLGGLSMALIVLAFVVLVVTKWLVLGRVQEGDYPLWQSYHLRFWFVQSLDSVFQLYYMPLFDGTPLVPFYHWMLGVQMGRGVYINGHVEGYDLVTIGDGCSLNCDSNLSAVSVEGNYLKLRRVSLGKGVTLGTRAVVQPDVQLDDYCKIQDMSLVPSMTRIPCHQTWGGSPIAFVETCDEKAAALSLLFSAPLPPSLWGIGTLQIVWAFLQKAMEVVFLVPFLYLIRTVPVLSMTEEEQGGAEGRGQWFLSLGTSLLHLIWLWTIMQLAMFLVGSGLVAVLKRLLLLLGGGEKDSYPLASLAFFRRWAVDNLMGSLTVFTKQLRGTVYLPLWYRLMGAKVGRHAEISAFEHVCAERMTLKDYVFVADDVIVGLPHVEKGMVTHGSVSIGRRSFVGNNSVVQARTSIADNVLVGVLSLAPKMMNNVTTAAATKSEEGQTFLGSPPFKIQRRAVTGAGGPNACAAAAATTTYDPPAGMLLLRYLVEGLGFVLLQVSLATCFALLYVSMSWFYTSIVGNGGKSGLVCYLLSLPFFIMGAAGVAALLTLFWKWTVIGRFKAGSYPLYGTYVWRTEFVERIEENLLQSYTYPLVTGTVWMQWVCQAMGVRMGRRAYLDNPYFCEPDLCTVGDYLNMERMASLQAHLFQDRVRTTGPVKVGDFCSLGSDSVVLVGGVMGDHCSLSSLSLVLRSEELPSHTQWHGLPAVRLFQHHDTHGAGGFRAEVEMGLLEEGRRGK